MKNRNDVSKITITESSVIVEFNDGVVGEEFFSSYPRLNYATMEERSEFSISYFGIHWPEIDEDLSFEGFYKKAIMLHSASI